MALSANCIAIFVPYPPQYQEFPPRLSWLFMFIKEIKAYGCEIIIQVAGNQVKCDFEKFSTFLSYLGDKIAVVSTSADRPPKNYKRPHYTTSARVQRNKCPKELTIVGHLGPVTVYHAAYSACSTGRIISVSFLRHNWHLNENYFKVDVGFRSHP